MCREQKCAIASDACKCCSRCYCGQRCYDCHVAWRYFPCPSHEELYCFSSADVRNKFVCFPCKRVWKSKTNKYQCARLWNGTHTSVRDVVSDYRWTTDLSIDNCRHLASACRNAYWNQNPRQASCAQCGQPGVQVGRNFRPCRTAREWATMQRAVETGEVHPRWDFREYPREKRDGVRITK